MKITKFTIAWLSAACLFISCNDDDDLQDGRFDRAELYASSNTNGAITVYDFAVSDNVTTTSLTVAGSSDNEGLFYSGQDDQLIFASRTLGSVVIAGNIENNINGITSALSTTVGSADLTSPRSVAVSGNFIVVADNAADELYIYQRSGNTVTLRNVVDVNIDLWQIQFDGPDLYAIVDNTSDLAVFNNFLSNTTNATVNVSKRITVEGITRTHGLVYNREDDIMVLTDIGSAAVDNDGAFHIITNFTTKFNSVANGGTLAVAGNQVRVAGTQTFLGNPVAASYDAETNTIFIAERANGGGRVLGFSAASQGNTAPTINNPLLGASTVFFYGED